MRSITPTLQALTEKPITAPTYLVKVDFSTPVYLTSGAIVNYGGNNYTRQGLQVVSVGESSVRFEVLNDDETFSALLAIEGASDVAVELALWYETEGVTIWTGFLDGAQIRGKKVSFRGSRVEAGRATWPDRYFSVNEFPYTPPDGTVLEWGSVTLTLRSSA